VQGNDTRWGETDFVLIGPYGIYCLEAKGNRISLKEGRWYSGESELNKSPFDQATGASSNVFSYLREKHPEIRESHARNRDPLVAYGVLFPDVTFDIKTMETNPAIVYDLRDKRRKFELYVNRLTDYWIKTHRRQDLIDYPYTSQEITLMIQALRREFDLRESLRVNAEDTKQQLIQLTDEQYDLLDHFDLELNPRMMVEGTAGSGKTLCAVELAKAQAAMGRKTLVTCFNKKLASHLRNGPLADYPDVEVTYFHKLMEDICRHHNIDLTEAKKTQMEDTYFQQELPKLCQKALTLPSVDITRYDTVIVDESQDLLLDDYLLIIDELLVGGLKEGRWVFFSDANQSIFNLPDGSAYSGLLSYGPSRHSLKYNCRNTTTTAGITKVLTGIDVGKTRADGPTQSPIWYKDQADQVRGISRSVNRLLSEGLTVGQITILSHRRFSTSGVSEGLRGVPYDIYDWTADEDRPPLGKITFSTIQSFKGLESDIVIIADIDSLEHPDYDVSKLNYVGSTRAVLMLIPAISDKLRPDLEHQLDVAVRESIQVDELNREAFPETYIEDESLAEDMNGERSSKGYSVLLRLFRRFLRVLRK
jgi:hypothetical protein